MDGKPRWKDGKIESTSPDELFHRLLGILPFERRPEKVETPSLFNTVVI